MHIPIVTTAFICKITPMPAASLPASPAFKASASHALVSAEALENKHLQGQMALYRGFLHEVNNALAGIGSLAEALKGSQAQTLDASLELIAKTAGRSAELQRKIRCLYSAVDVCECDLAAFAEQNKDVMELMLARSQKIQFSGVGFSNQPALQNEKDVLRGHTVVKISGENLWKLFSLILVEAKENQSPTLNFAFQKHGFSVDFEFSSSSNNPIKNKNIEFSAKNIANENSGVSFPQNNKSVSIIAAFGKSLGARVDLSEGKISFEW